jgi:uncharacterized protein (DUF2147 family)
MLHGLATARGLATALTILLPVGMTLTRGPALAADSPLGNWNTVDDKTGKVVSEVQLYDQGGKVYGKIVGLTEPNDDKGKPKTCTKCPGADKDQPIVGLVIIKDLSSDKDRLKGGTILDPEDGKVYKAELWSEGDKLKVRGYLGPFYKTQTWMKAK